MRLSRVSLLILTQVSKIALAQSHYYPRQEALHLRDLDDSLWRRSATANPHFSDPATLRVRALAENIWARDPNHHHPNENTVGGTGGSNSANGLDATSDSSGADSVGQASNVQGGITQSTAQTFTGSGEHQRPEERKKFFDALREKFRKKREKHRGVVGTTNAVRRRAALPEADEWGLDEGLWARDPNHHHPQENAVGGTGASNSANGLDATQYSSGADSVGQASNVQGGTTQSNTQTSSSPFSRPGRYQNPEERKAYFDTLRAKFARKRGKYRGTTKAVRRRAALPEADEWGLDETLWARDAEPETYDADLANLYARALAAELQARSGRGSSSQKSSGHSHSGSGSGSGSGGGRSNQGSSSGGSGSGSGGGSGSGSGKGSGYNRPASPQKETPIRTGGNWVNNPDQVHRGMHDPLEYSVMDIGLPQKHTNGGNGNGRGGGGGRGSGGGKTYEN